MSSNTLYNAGDVIVDSVVIVGERSVVQNITEQVVEIEIYESIDDVFMSGHLTINDGISLYSLFPFVGKEIVEINFHTPNFPEECKFSQRFYIHRVSNKESSGRVGVYTVYFSSYEYINDSMTKISRAFKGNASQVVETLLGPGYLNTTMPTYIEESKNRVSFVSNFWTPTKCIQYVTKNALNYKGNPSFLFFQNHNGFLFTSLDSLFDKVESHIYQVFAYVDNTLLAQSNDLLTMQKSHTKDYMKILDYKLRTDYDIFDKLYGGFYGGSTVTYNTGLHQYNYVEQRPLFEDSNHLNKYSPVPLIRPNYASNMNYIPTSLQVHDGLYDHTDLTMRVKRDAILSRLRSTEIDIVVNGRCDYTVGQIVSVILPKDRQYVTDENRDLIISGNYFVSSIVHNIIRGKHTCVLGLCKDSYLVDINRPALTLNRP